MKTLDSFGSVAVSTKNIDLRDGGMKSFKNLKLAGSI